MCMLQHPLPKTEPDAPDAGRIMAAAKDVAEILGRYGVNVRPIEIIAAVSGDWKQLARAAHALHSAIATEIN